MKTLEVRRATAPLADYVQRVRKEPVILTVDGKPVAALVSIKKADLEAVALGTHPDFLALIERSRARQRAEGGISSEEMRRRLGAKPKRSAAPGGSR
jgi:prevent-host-death family protein